MSLTTFNTPGHSAILDLTQSKKPEPMLVQMDSNPTAPLNILVPNRDMDGHTRLFTLFPDGVIETHDGYNVKVATKLMWSLLEPPICSVNNTLYAKAFTPSLSFFVDPAKGGALVTVFPDKTVQYRPGFSPSPLAREFWETLAATYPSR